MNGLMKEDNRQIWGRMRKNRFKEKSCPMCGTDFMTRINKFCSLACRYSAMKELNLMKRMLKKKGTS